MTPDKLPKEMQEQINNEADLYGFVVPYDGSNTFYIDDKVKGYQAGATAWAAWKVRYDELKHEIALLKEVNNESLKLTERCQNRYEALQDQAQRMADALDAFTNFFDKEIRLGYLQDKIPDYLKHRESLQQFKDGKGKDEPVEALRDAQTGAVWLKDQYDKLYDQVKGGKQTVCYVDYNVFGSDRVYRDICTIKAETMEFVSRGHGYGSVRHMSGNEKELFMQLCESIHVEWLCEGTACNIGLLL